MKPKQEFGGDWTEEKLERVRKYLRAYTKIFSTNVGARRYTTTYVDAFAGTGYRTPPQRSRKDMLLLPEFAEPDAKAFLKGSARIALETEPPFDKYIFIERDPDHIPELAHLQAEFPQIADRVDIRLGNATELLLHWCGTTDWKSNRAVVFLDPFGMQIEWPVMEAIAATKSVDLWLLFPLGVAVNRMLTKHELPPDEWARTLTRFFGTAEWQDAFYPAHVVQTLFGEEERQAKDADFKKIGHFFVQRLKSIFSGVADNPLPLYNSKNVPLFLLCFAAGNPKGAPTAIRIANHILRR